VRRYESFLGALRGAHAAAEAVAGDAGALVASCAAMERALAGSRDAVGGALGELDRLGAEARGLGAREARVRGLLGRYQLSGAQVAAMREGEVGEAFFDALGALDEALGGGRDGELRDAGGALGGLLEGVRAHRDEAVERLGRWLAGACAGDDPPDLAVVERAAGELRRAGRTRAFDETCLARRAALEVAFARALSGADDAGRALELHAPDPERYVGDLLAWVYQRAVQERELAEALFVGDDGRREALGVLLGGLCAPLGARVARAVEAAGEGGAVRGPLALLGLLSFYGGKLSFLRPGEGLAAVVADGCAAARAKLAAALAALGRRAGGPGGPDGGPAARALGELGDALSARGVGAEAMAEAAAEAAGGLLGPLLEACDAAGGGDAAAAAGDAVARAQARAAAAAAEVNLLAPVAAAARRCGGLGAWGAETEGRLSRAMARAVDAEADVVLAGGVLELGQRFRAFASDGQLRDVAAEVDGGAVARNLRALYAKVAVPGALPEFDGVADAGARGRMRAMAGARVAEAYEFVYRAAEGVYGERDLDGVPAPADLRTLLGDE